MNLERNNPTGSRVSSGTKVKKADKWDKPSLKKELVTPDFDLNDALCAQTDPELFFPEKGNSAEPAKAICRKCPVQMQCLEWALKNNEQHGIWGGLSAPEREKLQKRKPPKRHRSINIPLDKTKPTQTN